MSKYVLRTLQVLIVFACLHALGDPVQKDAPKGAPKGGEEKANKAKKEPSESRISADQMEMDMKNGLATFAGNVLISDAEMSLNCDSMTVHFTKEQKVSRVEAVGHVIILESKTKRRATAQKAKYDLEKGTITLIGDPVLETEEQKMYDAETITYDLNSEKVSTTGRAIIEFKAANGGFSLDGVLGPGGDKDKDPKKDEGEKDETSGKGRE